MSSLESARSQSVYQGQSTDVKAALDSIFDGILWKAVPKKRHSLERRRKRRMGEHYVRRYLTPKRGIVTCLTCGHWHERHTLCGNCYDKVRKETELMKEAMGHERFHYDQPTQEVQYVYKLDSKQEKDSFGKGGKLVVEMDRERPSWWPKHLLTKANE